MKAPCLGCDHRTVHPNCHMTCEVYKAYDAERKEICLKRNKAIQIRFILLNHPKDNNRKKPR